MRPILLLSLGAALSLAAPAANLPEHNVHIDDSDLLKVRHEVHIDDTDFMKVRHFSREHEHKQEHEDASHDGCILMKFFNAAPRYISKSLSRIETIGANSRLLPVFWFGKKNGEDDGGAPSTSLESTDVNELKHGAEILYLADGEHQSWGHHGHGRGRGRGRHHGRHHGRRPHPVLHTIMVWAHIISFLFLISFTVVYVITFVLRKTCDDCRERELEEQQQQREQLSEKEALLLVEEV